LISAFFDPDTDFAPDADKAGMVILTSAHPEMPDRHSEVSRPEMRMFVQDQGSGPWGYAPEGN
jgi:hypothetical protein